MPSQKKISLQFLIVLVLLVLSDQLTKFLAEFFLNYGEVVVISSFFNLRLVYNPGIAFSFFDDGGDLTWIALTAFSFIFAIGALIYSRYIQNQVEKWAIGLLIAGAIGNGIDRFRLGYVIDFLDFHLFGFHWPTFNIADSLVSLGAIIFICHQLFFAHQSNKDK